MMKRLPLVLSITALAVAVQSFPFEGAITGWLGSAYETTPTSEGWSLFVYAICANVSS